MDKILEFPAFNKYGESNNKLLSPCNLNIECKVCKSDFTKVADSNNNYPAELKKFLITFKPEPDSLYVLNSALGASEFFGPNNRGDRWPELGLNHKGPDYGYETWMYYGRLYQHHKNKDPKRAYGEVVFSCWDDLMKRILLIVKISISKNPEIIKMMMAGVYPETSMGAKVKFDICSICGHKSKTTDEYCTHLKYEMLKIYSDGQQVCAINPYPKFFDLSLVFRGAARESKFLGKIASEMPKQSTEEKKAVIFKTIEEKTPIKNIESLQSFINNFPLEKEKIIPKDILGKLLKYPPDEMLNTLLLMGIIPKKQEFQYLTMGKIDKKAADKYWNEMLFEPQKTTKTFQLEPLKFNTKIAEILQNIPTDRSWLGEHYINRAPYLQKQANLSIFSPIKKLNPMGKMYSSIKNIKATKYIQAITKMIETNPYALVLILAAGAGMLLTGKELLLPNQIGYDTSPYWPIEKTASIKSTIAKLLFLPPLGISYGAYQKSRLHRGKKLNTINRMFAEHPTGMGLGTAGTIIVGPKLLGRLSK